MKRVGAGLGAPVSVILALVFPAMIAAAMALAYYGYRHVQDVSRLFEASTIEDGRADAQRLMAAVEKPIDDAAQALFRQLGAAPPDDQPGPHCPEADGRSLVSSYMVLGPQRAFVCPPGKKAQKEWEGLRSSLRANWDALEPGKYKHEHTEDGQLIAYGVQAGADGERRYIAARINLDMLRNVWLRPAVMQLDDKRVEIVDERGTTLLGTHFGDLERFVAEGQLGRILYRWRIRVAPRDVETLQAGAEQDRVIGRILIILSTIIIAVGLGIVWLAVLAERRASRLKSDFIANVSHELKTPLSLIRMFGELVATGKHKGDAREYGGIITRESERLAHLIDNVLDFARIEGGKASYDFAEGDMAPVIERALDVCRFRLDKEKLRLHTQVDPGLPPVRMDPNAMTLVVLNLVDNAIKYAGDGGEVEVGLRRSPGGVVLTVRDFGPGVPAQEHAAIFERFYRASNARDRNVRGSGIGLSLVQHIAVAHGGRVTVESPVPGETQAAGARSDGTAGPGAIFSVYLPAPMHAQADADAAPQTTTGTT